MVSSFAPLQHALAQLSRYDCDAHVQLQFDDSYGPTFLIVNALQHLRVNPVIGVKWCKE
jgi:hypothetical protein